MSNLTWILLFPAPILVAAFFLFLGRQRRVGNNPHCRRCNYLLHGINSDRCPECGAMLSPAAIAYGERCRRRAPLLVGFTILALWIAFAWGGLNRLQSVDWYHYKPTFLVLKDLNSAQPTAALRAWNELTRRESQGSLSTANREKLVTFALANQAVAKTPFSILDTATIDYVGSRLSAGQLTEEQKTDLFDRSIRLQLHVRAKVIAGDPVPYLVDHSGLAPGNRWQARGRQYGQLFRLERTFRGDVRVLPDLRHAGQAPH